MRWFHNDVTNSQNSARKFIRVARIEILKTTGDSAGLRFLSAERRAAPYSRSSERVPSDRRRSQCIQIATVDVQCNPGGDCVAAGSTVIPSSTSTGSTTSDAPVTGRSFHSRVASDFCSAAGVPRTMATSKLTTMTVRGSTWKRTCVGFTTT